MIYFKVTDLNLQKIRILVKFTGGEDREVIINHNSVLSFQKFLEALREATHGLTFSVGEFDSSLWPDLFNRFIYIYHFIIIQILDCRIHFYCVQKNICKNLRPAENIGIAYKYLEEVHENKGYWSKEDYEEVYPDMVLGGNGNIKKEPVHIFVSEVLKKSKITFTRFTPTGLEGMCEMLNPPYTSKNQELRERQIITMFAHGSLRFYRFIVDQIGACPTLMLGSSEPSTMKTSTLQLCLKNSSDPEMFLAPGSSQASVDLIKSLSSHTVLMDDIEDLRVRHKIIMDGYNGAGKNTIERGEEFKIITMFLCMKEEVELSVNPNVHQLWVQAVKDQQSFLQTYFRELQSTDQMVSNIFYLINKCF